MEGMDLQLGRLKAAIEKAGGILYAPEYKGEYELELNSGLGISSWPATLMNLMGYKEPTDYDKSMINWK